MSDAAFDRALGAWEDGLLNAHLAREEQLDAAYEQAEDFVWNTQVREVYDYLPSELADRLEAVLSDIMEYVADGIAGA